MEEVYREIGGLRRMSAYDCDQFQIRYLPTASYYLLTVFVSYNTISDSLFNRYCSSRTNVFLLYSRSEALGFLFVFSIFKIWDCYINITFIKFGLIEHVLSSKRRQPLFGVIQFSWLQNKLIRNLIIWMWNKATTVKISLHTNVRV